jgi:hypothetical protein
MSRAGGITARIAPPGELESGWFTERGRGARSRGFEGFFAIALGAQVGGAPDIDLEYHAGKIASLRSKAYNTNNCISFALKVVATWRRYSLPKISSGALTAECAYIAPPHLRAPEPLFSCPGSVSLRWIVGDEPPMFLWNALSSASKK